MTRTEFMRPIIRSAAYRVSRHTLVEAVALGFIPRTTNPAIVKTIAKERVSHEV